MTNIKPPTINSQTYLFKSLTIIDFTILTFFLMISGIISFIEMQFVTKILLLISPVFLGILLVIPLYDNNKVWKYILNIFKYFLRSRKIAQFEFKDIGIEFYEDYIKFESDYIRIIEVKGLDFGLLSLRNQDQKIITIKNVFQKIERGKIIKFDKPLDFTNYINKMKRNKKNVFNEISKEILANEIDCLEYLQDDKSEKTPAYYLLIYNSSLEALIEESTLAINYLEEANLTTTVLSNKDINNFFELYFDKEFDENDNFIFDEICEKSQKIIIDNQEYCVISISSMNFLTTNAWLNPIFSIPETKVSLSFKLMKDKTKAIKRIDKSIIELKSRYMSNKITESIKSDLDFKIGALQNLIEELQIGSEELHEFTLEILTPIENKKQVIEAFRSSNIKHNLMFFKQLNGYLNMTPYKFQISAKENVKNLTSITLAQTFPFISKAFFDGEGDLIGANSESFVFFDIFASWKKLSKTRTNANMIMIGKPGSGKSYAAKKLLMQQSLNGTKIFVLDPENEYQYLAENMGGNFIDVGGITEGIINPLQVFPSLNDNQDDENYYGHLSL